MVYSCFFPWLRSVSVFATACLVVCFYIVFFGLRNDAKIVFRIILVFLMVSYSGL